MKRVEDDEVSKWIVSELIRLAYSVKNKDDEAFYQEILPAFVSHEIFTLNQVIDLVMDNRCDSFAVDMGNESRVSESVARIISRYDWENTSVKRLSDIVEKKDFKHPLVMKFFKNHPDSPGQIYSEAVSLEKQLGLIDV